MKGLSLILILNIAHLAANCQEIFTIKVLDSESNLPVKDAIIFTKGKVLKSNYLGFFQVEANTDDTIYITHEDYQAASLRLPAETSIQLKLTKEEELKCVWSGINFSQGDYYYKPIKVSSKVIKEDTYVYLILSNKRKAYLIINSSNMIISSYKTLKLIAENLAIDLMMVEKKKTFEVLPDKINPGRYFTIAEKEKEGLYFNVFALSVSQINQLRNQTIHSIHLGDELSFDLDDLTGKKTGKMFDCVQE